MILTVNEKGITTSLNMLSSSLTKVTGQYAMLNAQQAANLLSQSGLTSAEEQAIMRNLQLTESTKLLSSAKIEAAIANAALGEAEAATAREVLLANAITKKQVRQQQLATIATSALNFGVFALATTLVGVGIKAFSSYIHRAENVADAMEKAQQSIKESQDNLQNLSSTISKSKDRFLELSEHVDQLSGNISLSKEEYEEYLSISNDLAAIAPSLVYGYDAQGNALIQLGNNAEDTEAKLNEILETEKQLAAQNLINNMGDLAAGVHQQVQDALNEMHRLKAELDASSDYSDLANPENLFGDVDENTKTFNYGELRDTFDVAQIDELRQRILQSGARVYEDEAFDTISFFAEDADIVKDAIADFYQQINIVNRNENAAYVNGIKKDINAQEQEIQNAYSQMNASLSAWVQDTYEYNFLDEDQKKLVDSLVPNLDWNSIDPTGDMFATAGGYQKYIRENIIAPLMSIPDEYEGEINQKFAELLSLQDGDIQVVQLAEDIQDYFKDFGIEINLTPLFKDEKRVKEYYEQIADEAASRFAQRKGGTQTQIDSERKALDDFATQNSIDTQSELAFWNKCLEESNTREAAMRKYLEHAESLTDSDWSGFSEAQTEAIDSFESTMSTLSEALQKIATGEMGASDKIALLEQFPQLQGEADNLSNAITALMQDTLKTLYEKLGDDCPTEIVQLFRESAKEAINFSRSSEVINKELDELNDVLERVRKGESLSQEEIAKLINKHEDLSDSITVTKDGFSLEEDAIVSLVNTLISEGNSAVAAETLRTIQIIEQIEQRIEAYNLEAQAIEGIGKLLAQGKEGEAYDTYGTEAVIAYQEHEDDLAAIEDAKARLQELKNGLKKPETSSKDKDKDDPWLEEYEKKLSALETQLDMELITQREFYDQSEALLNQYLKDTPAHIEKYAEEISDAEKSLHDNWISAFEDEKEKLSKDLEDKIITDVQFYQKLQKLSEDYYEPAGLLSNGQTISTEAIEAIQYLQEELATAQQLGVDLNNTIYGNVDTNSRQILEWTEDNLNKYQNAIESWGATKDSMGDYSTVFASRSNYEGLEIAFTPILQTSEGAQLLSAETVDNYIYGLINQLKATGNTWTSEDLLRFDTEGLEIDGQRIKNLIAGIGEDAKLVSQSMHFTGGTGSVGGALENINKIAKETGVSVEELMTAFNSLEEAGDRYGDFSNEFEDANREIEKGMKELFSQLFDDVNTDVDELQNAFKTVHDAIDEYNESQSLSLDTVQSLLALDPIYLSMLFDEQGQLQLNEDKYVELCKVKLQEMQITMARNAVSIIDGIKSEAAAVEYLANQQANLRNMTVAATEELLRQSVAMAHLRGEKQGAAADMVLQSYENAKKLIANVSFSAPSLAGDPDLDKEEEKEEKSETKDWLEKLLNNIERGLDKASSALEKISDKTSKLVDSVDKFFTWQKKNAMINRAVKSTENEIEENKKLISKITTAIKSVKNISSKYSEKLNEVELPDEYKTKIKSGSLEIEEIEDEELQKLISSYEEWYGKIQDCDDKMIEYKDSIKECEDAIEDLYEQQRELIRQKLENVIDYYSDIDSYLSSVTSKVESLISLNDAMGKRSSLTELIQEFSDLSAQLSSTSQTEIKASVTEIDFGDSDKVKEAIEQDKQAEIDAIQAKMDNLDLSNSGTYNKLLKQILDKEELIDEYIKNGWDETRAKKFDKLLKDLENLYDKQDEYEAYATSDSIAYYDKIYTKFQKLQNIIDNGKNLSPKQEAQYESYLEQLEKLRDEQNILYSDLNLEMALAKGEITITNEEEVRSQLADIQIDLEETATYQNLEKAIAKAQEDLEAFEKKYNDKIINDTLSNKQKKQYEKLEKTLEDYYEKREAFDKGATASTIAEYNKIYNAWKKLQDQLDAGKNLSKPQWLEYEEYTKQLAEFEKSKKDIITDLETELDNIINPKDKISAIDAGYEEAAEGIYESYQDQIDNIENAIAETEQYKNLLAEVKRLEQAKKTKGLSEANQAKLDKYKAELEALKKGATISNIAEYIETWEKWYALQKKLEKNDKLSPADARNYDIYKAKLEAWNKEKQSQIDDLISLMEDELEALKKTYAENVSEAETEVNDYYADLYDLAKQIAEYNLTTLESQLAFLDAYISYYEQLVTLYDQFSGDKLSTLLSDLDIGILESQESLYTQYLDKLNQKYDATLSKINEYNELIEAIDTNDFEGSMQLFQDAIAKYKASGQTEMAEKLQSVLDLLNKRAIDQDNWDEYADQWLVEWEEALASAKSELIDIAGSIQEVNDTLRELSFKNITDAIQDLTNAQQIMSSIVGLINDDWLYDSDDNLTQYGLAKVGLLVEQMNHAKQEVNEYAQLINSIKNAKDTYSSDDAYETALQEAKNNYLTSISNVQGYQDSITSILIKADEAVINSLKEVINKRKEALQKKKELYDYNKTIKASQKEVDSIKAQIHAMESLSDATDAATKAKLAQLKAELEEKEEALQETKDEHVYSLQIDALDEFFEDLETNLEKAADAVNESFETYAEAINSAMRIYEENKDYLTDWSNQIINTVLSLGAENENVSDVQVEISDTQNESSALSSVSNLVSDSFASSGAMNSLCDLVQNAINDGITVKLMNDSVVPTNDQLLLSSVRDYMSHMDNKLGAITSAISTNNNTEINIHYDTLMNVEGSVDKDFAKVLPDYLEKSYVYTKNHLYKEYNRLK